eukprot:GHUV01048577.1.p1 GENE.GHUV01048577.1~~GHUV01048577.1.p1  ORF type:complete len:256 (+),score=61.91 GHUV01048577.1:442-1209(+)
MCVALRPSHAYHGTCRYYVANPAAKGSRWFGFQSSGAQPSLDPGFAGQQSMLKPSQNLMTAEQQIRVTAKGGLTASQLSKQDARISHDAEQGRRPSDDVQVLEAARVEQPAELELLKGVSGYAVPGKLMALMGGSGAGKTTLMDVICGRKTVGRTTGSLLVNGQPLVKSSWSRVVGYVEQMDVHTSAQTVIEALWFSGRLRLGPKLSDQQVSSWLMHSCMCLLAWVLLVFRLWHGLLEGRYISGWQCLCGQGRPG